MDNFTYKGRKEGREDRRGGGREEGKGKKGREGGRREEEG